MGWMTRRIRPEEALPADSKKRRVEPKAMKRMTNCRELASGKREKIEKNNFTGGCRKKGGRGATEDSGSIWSRTRFCYSSVPKS